MKFRLSLAALLALLPACQFVIPSLTASGGDDQALPATDDLPPTPADQVVQVVDDLAGRDLVTRDLVSLPDQAMPDLTPPAGDQAMPDLAQADLDTPDLRPLPPALTLVSPPAGPSTGGTLITLTGTRF